MIKTFFIIFGILIISTLVVLGIPYLVSQITGHLFGGVGEEIGAWMTLLAMIAGVITIAVRK